MTRVTVFLAVLCLAFGLGAEPPKATDSSTESSAYSLKVEVYKTPACGCCKKWISHLEAAGFEVEATDLPDLSAVKRQHEIPRGLTACHTAVVDGYVIEGHVPAADVQRLLEERPEIRGLAVPGMPRGSPGMEHPRPEPYSVYAIGTEGQLSVFSRHP